MLDTLLNESFVRTALNHLAWITPLAGAFVYFALAARKNGARGRMRAAAIAAPVLLAGPVLWLLWRLYESVMDHYGFSSVRGLLTVLVLFIFLGGIAGWALGRLFRASS